MTQQDYEKQKRECWEEFCITDYKSRNLVAYFDDVLRGNSLHVQGEFDRLYSCLDF